MEPTPPEIELLHWLFPPDYFQSMRFWRRDVIACWLLTALVTPSDPVSLLVVAVPLTAAWLLIRYAIVRNWSKDDRG